MASLTDQSITKRNALLLFVAFGSVCYGPLQLAITIIHRVQLIFPYYSAKTLCWLGQFEMLIKRTYGWLILSLIITQILFADHLIVKLDGYCGKVGCLKFKGTSIINNNDNKSMTATEKEARPIGRVMGGDYTKWSSD